MTVTRRLSDLFVVGQTFTIDDGMGDPITLWLQKLNSLEFTEASRLGDAERARAMTLRNFPESAEYSAIKASVDALGGRDALVDFVTTDARMRAEQTQEAKLAAEDEWAKDNYLQGLQDSWHSGLKETYAENPEDPEASRVFQELERFAKELADRVAEEIDALRDSYAGRPLPEIEDEALERMLQGHATQQWLVAYYRAQLYFGVREHEDRPEGEPHPEHKNRYFSSPEEIDDLQTETLARLRRAWQGLEVVAVEGKDSQEAPSSSPSSEQPIEAETEASSGQLVSVP